MISAFSGFALIGVIVAAGWAVGRWLRLPENAEEVIGRLVYAVLAPCLLFDVVSRADLHVLFTEPLLVSATAAAACTRIMGSLASGYTNANYIGLPVATYVLHDAALVVPIVMVQLLVITPIALTLLEIVTTGRASWRSVLTAPLRNPLIVAVVLGAVVALTTVRLPSVLADPIATVGHATVPVVLIVFGMSLHGQRVLAAGSDRAATVVAVLLKSVGMPAIAVALATALRLSHSATYAVTVLAGLPTAQNVFLYGQRFQTSLVLVRDAIFLSTVACVPALLAIAYLFTRS
jgi:malonate transporter